MLDPEYERRIAADVELYSPLELEKKVVLDIGANIGLFSVKACAVATAVIAVEPHPANVSHLTDRIGHLPNAIIIPKAVVGDAQLSTRLLLGDDPSTHSTLRRPGRSEALEVPAISLSFLLKLFRPNVIKCDIEGAEFDLQATLERLPKCVTDVAMELHIIAAHLVGQAKAMVEALEWQGFRTTTPPRLDPVSDGELAWDASSWEKGHGGWVTTGVWRR